jgi:D-3-phosphoglycerate dehydrogenase
MNLVRKFSKAITSVDDWRSKRNEEFLRSNELHSKKIGIIGLGRIGKKIATYASAFGLDISFYDPYVSDYPDHIKKVEELTSLNDCDIISINCYLTQETRGMITYGTLDRLKPGTVIVNTSRGEVIDENYILHLIDSRNILFGADVLQNEQNIFELKNSKLYNASKTNSNIVITPHVAGATVESQLKALTSVLELSKRAIV